MEPNIRSISSSTSNVRQDVFPFGQWTVTTRKGIILQSKCTCHHLTKDAQAIDCGTLCDLCQYHHSLPQLHSMPDMVFNKNIFRLEHYTGLGIEFNPLDALKLVEETKDPLQVAVAGGWQSARADFPFAKSVVKPFDWTFTTNYRGTLLPIKAAEHKASTSDISNKQSTKEEKSLNNPTVESIFTPRTEEDQDIRLQLGVEETTERIDVNKLKVREEILFYDDVTLYEDELADHGTAQYNVKVRVMPRSLFILARFYLRIDGVLARINDTRIYLEQNKGYLLREYTNREAKVSSLNLPVSTLVNPNELMNHLPIIHSSYEKLNMPLRQSTSVV